MTPSIDFQKMTLSQANEIFSPLTSPALRPISSFDMMYQQQHQYQHSSGSSSPMMTGGGNGGGGAGSNNSSSSGGSSLSMRRESSSSSSAKSLKKSSYSPAPYAVNRKKTPPVSVANPPPLRIPSSSKPLGSISSTSSSSAVSSSTMSSSKPSSISTAAEFITKNRDVVGCIRPQQLISPQLTPQLIPVASPAMMPITPAQLMNLDSKMQFGEGGNNLISPSALHGKSLDGCIERQEHLNICF